MAAAARAPCHCECACRTSGESGLKRVAKAVDAAVAAVGALFIERMQPALEAIAFHLGEACSLARCSDWMTPLVLQVRDCKEEIAPLPQTQHHYLMRLTTTVKRAYHGHSYSVSFVFGAGL